VFAVVAHGVARGWWGMPVVPAAVEGAGSSKSPRTIPRCGSSEETLASSICADTCAPCGFENARPQSRAARPLLRPRTRSPSPAEAHLRCTRCASTSGQGANRRGLPSLFETYDREHLRRRHWILSGAEGRQPDSFSTCSTISLRRNLLELETERANGTADRCRRLAGDARRRARKVVSTKQRRDRSHMG